MKNIPKLDGKAVVSFTVKVSENATEDDTIRNVALVKTPEKDDNTEDPSTWVPEDFKETNETLHPLSPWVTDDNEVTVIAPVLAIEKSSDKKTYNLDETAKYTVKVTNTKEDTEAVNVVIKDKFQTDGVAIDASSIRIADTDGRDRNRNELKNR